MTTVKGENQIGDLGITLALGTEQHKSMYLRGKRPFQTYYCDQLVWGEPSVLKGNLGIVSPEAKERQAVTIPPRNDTTTPPVERSPEAIKMNSDILAAHRFHLN